MCGEGGAAARRKVARARWRACVLLNRNRALSGKLWSDCVCWLWCDVLYVAYWTICRYMNFDFWVIWAWWSFATLDDTSAATGTQKRKASEGFWAVGQMMCFLQLQEKKPWKYQTRNYAHEIVGKLWKKVRIERMVCWISIMCCVKYVSDICK